MMKKALAMTDRLDDRWAGFLHFKGWLLFFLLILVLCAPLGVRAQWEPDVRLTYNDSASLMSYKNARCIAASGNTLHVVWYDNRAGNYRIYYKRSTNAGTTWGQDTCLSSGLDSSMNPSIAVSGQTVHLVWQDHRDGYWKVYYKRSTDAGGSWQTDTPLTVNFSGASNPVVTSLDSLVEVVYSGGFGSDSSKLIAVRSTDNGSSWPSEVCLTCGVTGRHWNPSIYSSGTSLFLAYVSYVGGYYRSSDINFRRSINGGLSWLPDTILLLSSAGRFFSSDYEYPSLVCVDSTLHLVSWHKVIYIPSYEHYYDVYMRSDDEGSTWSSAYQITPDSSDESSVCAAGTRIHVVWHENQRPDTSNIFYRRSVDGGANWELVEPLVQDSTMSVNPFVETSGAMVHVVWSDNRNGNYEIYYKRNLTGNSVESHVVPLSPTPSTVRVFPNPFVSFASVPGHASERFALYDISGRRVGVYRGDRIGSGLSAGVYFLKPESEGVKPVRIVKLR